MTIPDHFFDERINDSLLQNDMRHLYQQNKVVYGKTQRDYEQEQRDMLSSQDGDTCEIHDQFYRDHKLLLVLFRALAVMPITRSRPECNKVHTGIYTCPVCVGKFGASLHNINKGTITFSWKSSATIYAVCFYIVATFVVLWVGYERVMILQSIRQFDDYIYAIIFVIFLVPHFWIPFVGWGVANQVAIYKTNWGKFQVRYYRVTGENLKFPNLKTTIVIISVGCLLLAVGFLLSLCALLDGFLLIHTTAYYHIITMINMNCALWYINCRGIKVASQSLSNCFRRDVEIECSAKLISRYRFLWLNLSEQLQLLGNAYARTYSTYCLFMFANITIAVYGALSEIVDHGFEFSFKEIGLIVDAAYCCTLLFIFVDCSHKSTLKVAAGVQDTLLSIDVLTVDRPTQKEIDHFIQAIEMNPAVVSLKGYSHVNRELLTSAINMIAIYLIVLLQFKISLPKDPQIAGA